MSFTEDSGSDSTSDWKSAKMKQKSGKQDQGGQNKPKYFQKFCDKWLNIFHPWLARCDDDPNKPFCRACQCRLDCNRCHLQRHERTSKHARNLEILVSKGEGAARQNLSIRQERSKYYQQRKKLKTITHDATDMGIDTTDEFIEETEADGDTPFQFVPTEPPGGDQYSEENESVLKQEVMTDSQGDPLPVRYTPKLPQRNTSGHNTVKVIKAEKKDRMKILMQIQKDRNEMMDSFKELVGSGNVANSYLSPPPKEKNHVDLFFESVSSSVKALSPKLIAETKMRVSQLICELELRALTENDANASSAPIPINSSTVVVTSEPAGNSFIINDTSATVDQDDGGHDYQTLS